MLSKNKHIVVSSIILLIGSILLINGLFFRYIKIVPQSESNASVFVLSEWTVTKDTTVGGLIRDNAGRIKRTYTGKSPQACPT